MKQSYPVFDLHCDLTVYLLEKTGASFENGEDIGCALPHLKAGNVSHQVCAFFTPHDPVIHGFALAQSDRLLLLAENYNEVVAGFGENPENKIRLLPAIENASGICHEDEQLDEGFRRLQQLFDTWGGLVYIGFMHISDNRFGGAAGSNKGLSEDGRVLLDWLDGRPCAVDISHASDQSARDTLDYIEEHSIRTKVLASHSNMRSVYNHPRNLPDDLLERLIERKSLTGINFMKAYLNPEKPDYIYKHIEYALKKGAEDSLAFGADFFFSTDPSRGEIYHPEQANASRYPDIVQRISEEFGDRIAQKMAFRNAKSFFKDKL